MEARFKDDSYGSSESKKIPTAKGGAAGGHVLLPKIFQYSDKNVRGYEKMYRREVDALNIRKRNKGESFSLFFSLSHFQKVVQMFKIEARSCFKFTYKKLKCVGSAYEKQFEWINKTDTIHTAI